MSVTAVVGANWGDEGKGKLTDVLAAQSNYVVRYQGGSNAGHTIINQFGKFQLHMLPSGVFYPNVVNVLGPGVALNIVDFLREREELIARGVPEPKIFVSDRAQIVLPYHKLFDHLEEQRLGKEKFGSTKAGIAPFYSDKYLKIGVQVADLYEPSYLRKRIESSLVSKNVLLRNLYGNPEFKIDDLLEELLKKAEQLKPFVCDTTHLLQNAINKGEPILVEGQLGALRDPDHGIYPYSTSSSTLAGFASVGAGVPPYEIKKIVTVVKAYSSCVGAGPFVSEIQGVDANELREKGGDAGEYGATTGRPRRMGWFDGVATKYGCMLQGATEIALTNLDVLGYLDEIPICTAYQVDGESTTHFPVSAKLDQAKPVFDKLPGWKEDITGVRTFKELPKHAQNYILYIEKIIDVPVKWISVGPKRDQIIERD
ncbi:adenylosuccinate synthase [Chengkuizengella axinellae]|uniref:Adenylosuccinate synthetase n=1 Tax=Chengkuizengella axinellae TaxID=3064388 RepID=A0ABT9J602_9BACL|nr:adenylosuccinate synthase [Chengkuizengella sp. 2205SS18-9]MDP5277039.1 adenylosuccinate synthase [Chengkuizengella sp. 2205SS18-9]